MHTNLAIGCQALPPRDTLKALWADLEARADAPFFLSWTWISTWLDHLPAEHHAELVVARQAGRVIGLGLIVRGWTRRFRYLPVRCWRLHECGVEALDEITIEYNGFLVERAHAADTRRAMVVAVQAQKGHILQISGASPDHDQLDTSLPQHLYGDGHDSPTHWVSLDDVRQHAAGFEGLLSASRRSRLRKSLSAYEALGPVRLEQANDLATARAWLDRLFTLNAQSWDARGGSRFATEPLMRRFHARLVDTGLPLGQIQLLRLCAGDQEIAYIYNFVHRGHVYFYQAGLRYGLLDKHDAPGYVAHLLAIQANAEAGHRCYDFMAGDADYKRSLSTHGGLMLWRQFGRRTWLSATERAVRAGVRGWRQRRQATADGDGERLAVHRTTPSSAG